jgi:hypothetical protein
MGPQARNAPDDRFPVLFWLLWSYRALHIQPHWNDRVLNPQFHHRRPSTRKCEWRSVLDVSAAPIGALDILS